MTYNISDFRSLDSKHDGYSRALQLGRETGHSNLAPENVGTQYAERYIVGLEFSNLELLSNSIQL